MDRHRNRGGSVIAAALALIVTPTLALDSGRYGEVKIALSQGPPHG